MKHEKWTRIVRVGDEYAGTARLHTIMTDMITLFESPPDIEDRALSFDQEPEGSEKPWALLFDPEACDKEQVGKTVEEMELPEAQIIESARKITVLREHMRLTAATLASQPDQLRFYE